MDLQLSNRTALVTGSNRGTGLIIANTLAAEGARVIYHSNEPDAAPVGVEAVWGDIRSDIGAAQVLSQLAEHIGPKAREIYMTTAERLKEEGVLIGEARGEG